MNIGVLRGVVGVNIGGRCCGGRCCGGSVMG